MLKFRFLAGLLAMIALGSLPASSQAAIVGLQNADATYSQPGVGANPAYPVGQAIDGNKSGGGWSIGNAASNTHASTSAQSAVFEAASNVGHAGGTLLTFTLTQTFGGQRTLGKFKLSVTTDDRDTFANGAAAGVGTANWLDLVLLSATSTNGATLTIVSDGSILASGTNPDTAVYTITAYTNLTNITGFRLDALLDGSLPGAPASGGPGRRPNNGNFVLTEFEVDAVAAVPEPTSMLAWGGLMGIGALVGYRRRRAK